MSINRRAEDSPEHLEICALIPWYVNASLAERERPRVEAHMGVCAICRDVLSVEQRIFERINDETAIEYIPMVSLKRLQARLDILQSAVPPDAPEAQQPRSSAPWRGLMAASIAAMTITISLLVADRWLQFRTNLAAPNFRTVTSATTRPRDEVIRAVFSPTITLVELQAILEESQLRIISGPTEAGVYSLAAKSNRTVGSSLALLRQHPTVRFAEGTRLEPEPGNSP
jgi:hypothetical protein